MYKIAAAIMAGLIVISFASTSAVAGEREDIAKAEELIKTIKIHQEADTRAYWRAVTALAGTSEGRMQMQECAYRSDQSYWGTCMTDDDWKFHGAYRPLYEQFYDEELNIVLDELGETMTDEERQELEGLLRR